MNAAAGKNGERCSQRHVVAKDNCGGVHYVSHARPRWRRVAGQVLFMGTARCGGGVAPPALLSCFPPAGLHSSGQRRVAWRRDKLHHCRMDALLSAM